MFNYFALVWNSEDVEQNLCAAHLKNTIQSCRQQFKNVFEEPGFSIYTTGDLGPAHGVCQLPEDRGVIVGALFSKSAEDACAASRRRTLTEQEGKRISESNGRQLTAAFWGAMSHFSSTHAAARSISFGIRPAASNA